MKKLLLILFLCIPLFAYATETNVTATNDGYILCTNETYTVSRDATDGTSTSSGNVIFGQNSTDFMVIRSFLSFSIPSMSAITSCSLYLKGAGADYSDDNFDIYIHSSTYSSIATTDFELFDGWTSGASHTGTVLNDAWNSSSFLVNDWIHIDFNAAGKAAVLAAQGSTLKICIISKEDFDRSEPMDKEYLSFTSSLTEGSEPYLALNYTESSGYTGTAMGLATPANVMGVVAASLLNFIGVE
jgi:hypothetical protein